MINLQDYFNGDNDTIRKGITSVAPCKPQIPGFNSRRATVRSSLSRSFSLTAQRWEILSLMREHC